MDLRELKKEAHSLPNLQEQLHQFQLSWVKLLRAKNSPVLAHLDRDSQQRLKKQLSKMNPVFAALRQDSLIQEKLPQQARYLVELKLNKIQGNESRCRQLIQQLLKDPFLSITQSLKEVQLLEKNISQLAQEYASVNVFLEEQLPLEGALLYADGPHQHQLEVMQKSVQRQRNVMHRLAEQFITLTRSIHTTKGKRKN